MTIPEPLPAEQQRLEVLARYEILDTPADAAFDELTELASQICGAPIALISLVDKDRQWFKSRVGFALPETPRGISFCQHTIAQDDIFVVEDALLDTRFAACPLVTGDLRVRFYAGAPLVTPEGYALGGLCVMDRDPHKMLPEHRKALLTLSRQVMAQFELCRRSLERNRAEVAARENADLLRTVIDLVPHHVFAKDREGRFLFVNRTSALSHGRKPEEMIGLTDADIQSVMDNVEKYLSDDRDVIDQNRSKFIAEEPAVDANGQRRILQTTKIPFTPPGSNERAVLGVAEDITERKQAEEVRDNLMHLIECSDDFIALGTLDGCPTFMNGGARKMIGLSADEDISRLKFTDYVPERWQEFFRETVIGTTMRKGIWEGEMQLRHTKTGALIDVARTTFVINDVHKKPRLLASITRDVTARNLNAALMIGQKQVLEMIAAGVSLEATLTALLRVVEAQSPGLIGSVLLVDSDGLHLRHGAAPSLSEAYIRAIDGIAIGPNVGSCGTAAYSGKEIVVEDIVTDPLWADFRDLALFNGLRACWSTPICDAEKKVLGTFAIYYRQPCRPMEHHRRLIDIASHTASIAIGRDHSLKLQRDSLERFQIVSRVTNDIIWDWNVRSDRMSWNEGFTTIFGYAAEDIESGIESWAKRLHPDDKARVLADLFAKVNGSGSYWSAEYRFRCSNGSYVDIEDCACVMRGEHGRASRIIGAMKDVTERKQAQLRIQHLNRVYAVLSEINQTIVREKDVQAIRNAACRIAVEKGGFCMAWMGLADKTGSRIQLVAHAGGTDETLKRMNDTLCRDSSNHFMLRAYQTGQRIICNNSETCNPMDCCSVMTREHGCRSMSAFPLRVDGEIVGTFNLYHAEADFFDAKELQLLDELALDIGFGLELNRHESQRLRAEKALRWRTAFLDAQMDSSPDAILVVDSRARIILRNERLIKLFHVPASIADDDEDSLLLRHVVSQAKYPEQFAAGVAHLYANPNETGFDEIELQNGMVLTRYSAPVRDKAGIYYGRIWTFRDVTERKRAEETLLRSELSLQAVLNATVDGILATDCKRKVLFANRRFLDMWRISQTLQDCHDDDALLGCVLDQLTDPQSFLRRVNDLYTSEHDSFDTLHFKDGRIFERLSRPLKRESELPGRVWSFRDVTERKRAEESLRASEEQYRLLADNTDDIVTLYDNKNNRRYVSPSFFRITGWTLDDIQNAPWHTRLHPDDLPTVENARAANLAGEATTIDYRLRCKNGRWIWLESRCKPVCGPDGNVKDLLLWSRDITARRQAEDALRTSELRLNFALESSEIGAWERTLPSNVLKRTAIYDHIFGYPLQVLEWTSDLFFEHVVSEDRTRVTEIVRNARAKLAGWDFECRIRRADGEIRWIWVAGGHVKDSAGKVMGLSGIIQDITARRNAEESLRESEERFRQLAENIDEVFWIQGLDSGRFLYASPAYETIWGRPRTSLYDVPGAWIAAIHPEDRERVEDAKHTKQNRGGYDETYRILRPDGSLRWIRDRAFPLHNASGDVFRVVGTASDITENRKLAKQVQQAQKMEAFGLLAGGVAHDFNNLLSVVIGYCDLWLGRLPAEAPIRSSLATIKNAGDRAAVLTRQLLAFSRQSIMDPKVLDLNAVVRDTEKILSRLIGDDIELKCVLDPEIEKIKVDPGQIGQVLINLAVNARDAMPRGGTLTILTLMTDFDEAYVSAHPGSRQGGQVMLSVRDTGCGMSPETMAHIFEPFFTTKEIGKGTGLGLAVVHGVVTQSGGTIQVLSELEKGTTFNLHFPATTEAVVRPTAPEEKTSFAGTETVLVVEDEEELLQMIADLLEAYGYTALMTRNGSEALDRAAKTDRSIDLLLTDVIMPGMSGRELSDRLKKQIPDLNVLFMSGYTDDSVLRHGVNQHEVAFLQKPFVPQTLLEKVRNALDAAVHLK